MLLDGKSTSKSEVSSFNSSGDNEPPANAKKDAASKQTGEATPETFGPALFSTPDIIKKISDDPSKDPNGNGDASGNEFKNHFGLIHYNIRIFWPVYDAVFEFLKL